MNNDSRINEWYVPKFGPVKFRIFIGMLFLPYTGMCISFVVLGGLMSHYVNMERLFAISVIYFISLGIAAHLADNIGSKMIKPWGMLFSKKQSWFLIMICLFFSYLLIILKYSMVFSIGIFGFLFHGICYLLLLDL